MTGDQIVYAVGGVQAVAVVILYTWAIRSGLFRK